MTNTKLTVGWYGALLALGIEATTPITGDKKKDGEQARLAIDQTATAFYNTGAFDGEVQYTHDRFAYIITDEKRLVRAFENMLKFDVRQHFYNDDKPAPFRQLSQEMRSTRQIAQEEFASIPRENFLLGQAARNQHSPHNVDGAGYSFLSKDALVSA